MGDHPIDKLDRNALQELLDRNAESCGSSIIDHLRFDLRAIFEMAVEDGLINRNPARSLFTVRRAHQDPSRAMAREEVVKGLAKLGLRERLIWKLAGFGGFRPGEIFGLQRRHIQPTAVKIEQRVYAGKVDTPKSRASSRLAALPATLASDTRHGWPCFPMLRTHGCFHPRQASVRSGRRTSDGAGLVQSWRNSVSVGLISRCFAVLTPAWRMRQASTRRSELTRWATGSASTWTNTR